MSSSFNLRWGIIATGWISTKFSLDLLVDPATREVSDVKHTITAVGSRSAEKAEQWVKDTWAEAKVEYKQGAVKTYGDYAQVYANKDVDAIYIGTPHSNHYEHAHAALTAGKHVLCEKSLTVNAAQAQILADLAHKNKLFFMEAVWTRFQPVSFAVDKALASGVIGNIVAVRTELSVHWQGDDSHRMVNPDLAGGAFLDLGPYSWVWLALTLLPRAPADGVSPLPKLKVAGSIIPYPSTGMDAHTTATIQFPQPDGRTVHGTMTASLSVPSNPHVVFVQGTKGFLQIKGPTYRPEAFSYTAWASEEEYGDFGGDLARAKTGGEDFSVRPGGIWGFAWEADEVARCIRDGKLQSARMPVRETVLQMAVFDQIREQNGLVYPEALETLELSN